MEMVSDPSRNRPGSRQSNSLLCLSVAPIQEPTESSEFLLDDWTFLIACLPPFYKTPDSSLVEPCFMNRHQVAQPTSANNIIINELWKREYKVCPFDIWWGWCRWSQELLALRFQMVFHDMSTCTWTTIARVSARKSKHNTITHKPGRGGELVNVLSLDVD